MNYLKIISFCLLLVGQLGFSQHITFGPNVNFGFTNIANSTVSEGRAVIGDNLWGSKVGFSVVYDFKDRRYNNSRGIHFEYSTNERGSVSEVKTDSKFFVKAQSFNLNYRYSTSFQGQFCAIYADLGIGYNVFSSKNFYSGSINELTAFQRIQEKFELKKDEVSFLFSLGVDKLIFKDKCIVFFELNGDAGISKINFNGPYRTQGFGFGTGIKYLYDFKKKK